VGEPLEVRHDGGQVSHTTAQLRAALSGVTAAHARTLVVAYEPVWAIGTGEVATPQDAQEVCGALRSTLDELYTGDLADGVRILYGGSVKPDNCAHTMVMDDVDGALVGGASLDPKNFAQIVRYRSG
jgi:triosephosphate isomerase (TIM)